MKRIQNKRGHARWLTLLVPWLVLMLAGIFTATPVHAATNAVTMSASVGFNGFYNKYNWVPVELVLKNPGPTTDAVVRVDVDDAFDATRNAAATLEWGVKLVHGKTVTREISVPGWVIDSNGTIECWTGSHLAASVRLSGNELGRVAFAAVLSDHPQSAQFLTGSTDGSGGLPMLPLAIRPSLLSVQANLLSGLAAVVTAPGQLAKLDVAHQTALLHWLKLGGLLIVTGTDPQEPDWNGALPLLPGPAEKYRGQDLARFAGIASAPSQPLITKSSGIRPEAQVWAGTTIDPLIASLQVGRGMVVQTAFAPSQSALLTWPNNASLWTEVFGQGKTDKVSALPPALTAQPLGSLASASGVLAPLRVPSLRLWGSVFGIYVILVGPILFLILRRLRAEPWAWLILPLISVVTTVVMYGFGLSERPSGLLTDGVGVLDLIGNGVAESVSVRSFTAPVSSAVALATDKDSAVLPLVQGDSRRVDTVTVEHGKQTVVQIHHSGRWVVHDILASGTLSNQGSIELHLGSDAGSLSGTVVNATPYLLNSVALCWDGHLYELGNLNAGQSITVDKSISTVSAGASYLQAYSVYNRILARGIGRSISNYAADVQLLANNYDKTGVMVVATTPDATSGMLHIVGNTRVSTTKQLVLVREFGEVAETATGGMRIQ